LRHGTPPRRKICELYQPLIEQAIYADDQLILLNQLLSSPRIKDDLPLDSIAVLNRVEYILNVCRTLFRDATVMLNQMYDLDLRTDVLCDTGSRSA